MPDGASSIDDTTRGGNAEFGRCEEKEGGVGLAARHCAAANVHREHVEQRAPTVECCRVHAGTVGEVAGVDPPHELGGVLRGGGGSQGIPGHEQCDQQHEGVVERHELTVGDQPLDPPLLGRGVFVCTAGGVGNTEVLKHGDGPTEPRLTCDPRLIDRGSECTGPVRGERCDGTPRSLHERVEAFPPCTLVRRGDQYPVDVQDHTRERKIQHGRRRAPRSIGPYAVVPWSDHPTSANRKSTSRQLWYRPT